MIQIRRSIKALAGVSCASFVVFACSSSDSPAATPDSGKTDAGADGAKTPAKKTASAPTAKPPAKAPPKPTASATAPKSDPPTTPPKSPDLDNTTLLTESGFEIDASCAKAGLTDGKGYCLPSTDYLVGCVGGKLLGFDCGALNSSTMAVACEDDPKAGCYGVDLSPVASDISDDAAAYGISIDSACKTEQEGKGFCLDSFAVVCTGGKYYALDCKTYLDTASCKANSDGALSCF